MKPALLVIDMQNQFFTISTVMTESLNDAVRYINAAIALFRDKQLPVVCIQHTDTDNRLVPGEGCFEVPDSLHILESDLRIHKSYGNAFNKTPLEDKLREMGVDNVIVTGFCVEHCVLSTYRGAKDRDLTPIILRGAIASDVLENIGFVERISDIISYGALKHVLA